MNKYSGVLLSKQYLGDEVSKVIKEQIFDLKYHRGERLIVETLAAELGVSMTPVREGLKLLVNQGIVGYNGKSYVVFNPRCDEIHHIFSIRRYLDKLAAFSAAENCSTEELDAMYQLQNDLLNNREDDLKEFIASDIVFHSLLLESTGNERLINIGRPINEQCHLLRLWSYEKDFPKENLVITVNEHLAILDAIKKGKAPLAETAMEKHLIRGEKIAWKMFDNFF